MTYHLELLGDERFQQLCQALLTKIFPNVQCLPVGQPDGGRDAFQRTFLHRGKEKLLIFQVKFVKNPATKESRDLIESVIRSEASKIATLVERGAFSYYLMTNAAGTSHLDVGSVDKVNDVLASALKIPAYCWWRDDVERRIDNSTDIKWSFPEILKATDLLAALLDAEKFPEVRRRSDSIRSYMAFQSQQDSKLKFKQIDLQKNIEDLFVDLPAEMAASPGLSKRQHATWWSRLVEVSNVRPLASLDEGGRGDQSIGALELMTKESFISAAPRLVIEGAPGQGKSTLTQYLCQVNRLLLLNRLVDYQKVSERHRPESARIPFRVDLRDYASWLAGRNPFSDDPTAKLPFAATPVLESFIAAQVHRYTGADFSVDDLTAISRISKILLVLDGFDEVADVRLRDRIVSEVSDAAARIAENAISSQIIVTSRPAAFANSQGFPRDSWQYLQILPLTSSVIKFYADRWLQGRETPLREKMAVLNVLDEKLALPHVRDLATNPMQLAILLALISVQGASLPNKRTALYDNYIEIFLNRESEKSSVVRDHRDLLVGIHRFLAWKLQSEAEESGSGNISDASLRLTVRAYLETNGHDVQLVEKLFSGMVERVVALVSRVQGTFEFEVQPLREYFAARHLYDTAKYAQAGIAVKGSLPDRFDALARNFYWLNVTRFYAGCYSSGELASLIDGIDDLKSSDQFNCIGYVAKLSVTLLNDYVFSQLPKLEARIADKLKAGLPLYVWLAEGSYKRSGESIVVTPQISQARVRDFCADILSKFPDYELASVAARAFKQNSSSTERVRLWRSMQATAPNIEKWLDLGQHLAIFAEMSAHDAHDLIREVGPSAIGRFAMFERSDVFSDRPEYWTYLVEEVVLGRAYLIYLSPEATSAKTDYSLVVSLSTVLWPYFLNQLQHDRAQKLSVGELIQRNFYGDGEHVEKARKLLWEREDDPLTPVAGALQAVLCQAADEFWSSGLTWNNLLESCKVVWGEKWSLCVAAVGYIASSGCSKDIYSGLTFVASLSDSSSNLFARAATARFMATDSTWWSEQFVLCTNKEEQERLFYVLCLVVFSPISHIVDNAEELSAMVEGFGEEGWGNLVQAVRNLGHGRSGVSRESLKRKLDGASSISPKVAVLLMPRLAIQSQNALWRAFIRDYDGDDGSVWMENARLSFADAAKNRRSWIQALRVLREVKARGFGFHVSEMSESVDVEAMPSHVARQICESPIDYPLGLVGLASLVITNETGAAAITVSKVAAKEDWFADLAET